MESDPSLPCSQVPAIRLHTEEDNLILFIENLF